MSRANVIGDGVPVTPWMLAPQPTGFDLANFRDGSGNARHLTLGGAAGYAAPAAAADPWGTGQNATVFTGQQGLVAASPGFVLPAGDYTWEGRFKRDVSKNGTTQILFGRWFGAPGGGPAGSYSYLLYLDPTNKLTYIHSPAISVNIVVANAAATTDAGPHSFAAVKSAGTLSLYLDGVRVAGPTAVSATLAVPAVVPFRLGDYEDGTLPFYGTLGDFRFSTSARYSGASYAVPTTPLTTDGSTSALLPLSALAGTYLSAPVYQGNVLTRAQFATATGGTAGSGGLANPDGPLPTLDGKWFYTLSAFNGTQWTIWAVVANTLAQLYAGSGTVQAAAIQTPTSGEGSLAGNGTVVAFGGQYHHYYQTGSTDVRHSTGSSLGAAFSAGTTIFAAGTGGYSGYFDPFVRASADGTYLEMFLAANPSARLCLRSTSADGATWTTPTVVVSQMNQPGYSAASSGEPAFVGFGAGYLMTGDGAATNGNRVVIRWASPDGVTYLPLKQFIAPAGGGYISVYDDSPYYDVPNARVAYLCTNSTNTQTAQPTDSDIGLWYAAVSG